MTQQLIEKYELEKLEPLGGYIKSIYESPEQCEVNGKTRPLASECYYYIDSDDFGCWHRLDCDELWHFYTGSDLIIHMINDAGELTTACLGDPGDSPQAVSFFNVPANTWFAFEVCSEGSYAFSSTTCVPGYADGASKIGEKTALKQQFPQHENIINRFSR